MKTKNLLFAICIFAYCLLSTANLFSQAPQKFNYQGVCRDSAGLVIKNQNIGVKISILQSSPTGTAVYSEKHTTLSDARGIFSIVVGGGTVLSGSITSINWGGDIYFVKTEIDITGGNNFQFVGTTQLLSVPYALYAETSGTPGVTGPTGAQGIQGVTGATGATGTTNINGTTNYLVKFTGATTGGNSLLYDDGTHLGVGTTSPLESFTINNNQNSVTSAAIYNYNTGNAAYSGYVIRNSASSGAGYYLFGTGYTGTGSGGAFKPGSMSLQTDLANGLSIAASNATGSIHFFIGNLNASDEKMTITTAGNVGIGTTTPSQKLSVAGTIESTTGGIKFPDGTTQTTAASGSSGNPVGTILSFAGTTSPSGYLLCDGSAVSRTTYAALYAEVGNAWGSGDGSTTFNLPDLRGRFLRGVDGTAGNDPDNSTRTAISTGGNTGNNVGSVQNHNIISHNHNLNFTASTAGVNSASSTTYLAAYTNGSTVDFWNSTPFNLTGNTVSIQNTGGSETRPKNAYVNFIIKY